MIKYEICFFIVFCNIYKYSYMIMNIVLINVYKFSKMFVSNKVIVYIFLNINIIVNY